ncbi:prolipoprotein diacylglyceryl transferase, partial [Patescibacteria group bacterium]|nr:prolipoprotein diacylglyceryl transferase [Patescibacteria group bacterium]
SLLDLMLFVLLYKLFNRRQANSEGIIVLWYLIGYSTIRFFLEFLRPNPWRIFGFPVGGIFSLVVFFTSIFLLARGRRGYDNPDIPKSRARPGE